MYSLYRTQKFTDMIVKCEEKEFNVHKTVLASQSAVFRANLKILANDVADKYQLHRLLKMCECDLRSKMTEINVINALIQADLCSRASLKNACFEFIRRNIAKMFEISEWECLKDQHTSLYLEALEYCVPKM